MLEETVEKEEAIADENIVDLQQFVPVGGVYHIDALQLPPQVKQIKDWSMVEVREHLKPDSVKDEGWSLYLFNGRKAQKLKITESSEAFSEELEDDSEFHSTLYHMLKDFASKAAIARVEAANFVFVDGVYQLLLAMRLLTYS